MRNEDWEGELYLLSSQDKGAEGTTGMLYKSQQRLEDVPRVIPARYIRIH